MSTEQPNSGELLAFGEFEFSATTQELRHKGEIVRLQQQPTRVLQTLLRRPGELVTRQELCTEVWGSGIHLEFDDALNHNIKYLRDALGDAASKPRFIETVPRRGYRFIAPVRQFSSRPTPLREEVPSTANAVVPPAESLRKRRPLGIRVAVALAGLAAMSAVGMAMFWTSASATRVPRVLSVVQLTHIGRAVAAVSDGNRLYVEEEKGGTTTIVSLPADGAGEPTPLRLPFENVLLLDISPDRQNLLIAGSRSASDPPAVWVISLSGESPRRLGEVYAGSAKWSPDGSRIAFVGTMGTAAHGLYTVAPDGSGAKLLAGDVYSVDSWSPDSRSLRFTRVNGATGAMTLWEIRADGSRLHSVFAGRHNDQARWGEGQCCGVWTRDGRYFVYNDASGPQVRLQVVEDKGGTGAGVHPQELYSSPLRVGATATSPDGRVLFVGWKAESEIARFDPKLREFVPLLPGVQARFVAFSPDRKWIAYTVLTDGSLWKVRIATGQRIQLTFAPMQAFGPVWSPDGRQIAFHVLQPGKPGKIVVLPADGGMPRILFAAEPTEEDAQQWSPDGKSLMFGRVWLDKQGNSTRSSTCIVNLASGKVSELPGSDDTGPAVWSPDGRYVVAQSSDFRRLLLFDFRTQTWKTIAKGARIWQASWSRDSRSVIYQDALQGPQQPIYRISLASGKTEIVATRNNTLRPDIASYRLVGLTPDDQPVAALIRRNADVYSLKLDLP